jgi:hypothetical protein
MAGILFLLIGVAGFFLGFMQEATDLTPLFRAVSLAGFAICLAIVARSVISQKYPEKRPDPNA